jgi:hypothetical protein
MPKVPAEIVPKLVTLALRPPKMPTSPEMVPVLALVTLALFPALMPLPFLSVAEIVPEFLTVPSLKIRPLRSPVTEAPDWTLMVLPVSVLVP